MKWVKITEEWFTGDHPNPLHPTGVVINPVKRQVRIYTFLGHYDFSIGDEIQVNENGEAVDGRWNL